MEILLLFFRCNWEKRFTDRGRAKSGRFEHDKGNSEKQ